MDRGDMKGEERGEGERRREEREGGRSEASSRQECPQRSWAGSPVPVATGPGQPSGQGHCSRWWAGPAAGCGGGRGAAGQGGSGSGSYCTCTIGNMDMYVQSLRQGRARQLHVSLKTTLFPIRKRRSASGRIRTCNILHTRQMLYQLSH